MVVLKTPEDRKKWYKYRDKDLSIDERIQLLFNNTKIEIKELFGLKLTLGEQILLKDIYCKQEIEHSSNSNSPIGGFEEDIEIVFRFVKDIYGLNIPPEYLSRFDREGWKNLRELFKFYQEKDHLPFLY
jgi:hypothetical protein